MEQVRVKVANTLRKRAKTWEISDSEDEETGYLEGDPKTAERETQSTQCSDGGKGAPHRTTDPLSQQKGHDGKDAAEESSKYDQSGPEPGMDDPSGCRKKGCGQPSVQATSSLSLPPSKPTTTPSSPGKKMRKKRSPEELEADRAQAEERKRVRELKRQEKERIKNLEKEEREKRKESAQALKILRPDQCGKYMAVQVDAGFLQDAGSEDVLQALTSAGYTYSIEPHSVPWSITWRRQMPADWTTVDGLELCNGEEDQMLIVVQPKDFLRSVSGYVQAPASCRNGEVSDCIFEIAKKHPKRKITLVVLGLHDYRRWQKLSRKMEKHSQDARGGHDENPEGHVTRRDIDEAFVFLQLYRETEVLFPETWGELGQHVCAVTKSIAQRPSRLHGDAQSYSFCTSVGSWRGWGPRGSLTGLPLAWKRQIQQFNRVSPAMAAAITEAYPSPQLLVQAYAACNTDKERLLLLSNLKVPRGGNAVEEVEDPDGEAAQADDQTQTRDRRIGPDLSRRICLFMTSTNPELVLDLNS